MTEVREHDRGAQFVETPIFQEKIRYFESLDEDERNSLVEEIIVLVAKPNQSKELEQFFRWHLTLTEHLGKNLDVQPVIDEGLASGYISESKDLYNTIFTALDQCEMFCETQALFSFREIASSMRQAWLSDQASSGMAPSSSDLEAGDQQSGSSNSISKSVSQMKNDLALLQTVRPLTTLDAFEMILTFECKRLTLSNQSLAGIAVLFFGAVLLASQSPVFAERMLLEARSRCSKVSGHDLEHAAILGLLFQMSSNEDQSSFGEEIELLCRTELKKFQTGVSDPSTMRKLASSLVEVTVNLQDLGQQEVANENYGIIIKLFESASSSNPDGDDANTVLDWATAYMNRGNVKRALEPPEIEAALIDYRTGISMKEDLIEVVGDLPSFFMEQIRGDLEKGYSNVASAEQQLQHSQRHKPVTDADMGEHNKTLEKWLYDSQNVRPKEAGYDALSRVIGSLFDRGLENLKSKQKFALAEKLVQRGRISLLQQSGARIVEPTPSWVDHALDEAFNDFDEAIGILSELKKDDQFSQEKTAQEYGRAYALRSASYKYTTEKKKHERALEDINRALDAWKSIEDSSVDFFDACLQKCKILIELGNREEALVLATSSLTLRSKFFNSIKQDEKIDAYGGVELANLAAHLLSTSGRVADALVLLAKNTALLSQHSDQNAPSHLSDYCIDDLRKLAPDHGAVVVPVVLDEATSVLIFTDQGKVGHIEFGYWISNNAKVMFTMSAMDAVSQAPELRWAGIERSAVIAASGFWRYFVEPIWECLEKEIELPLSAPVTFVTQDALDYIPLHAAARRNGDTWKFAIEDRVIRYAPSLYALSLMKKKKTQGEAESIFGFFDPLGDLPTSRYYEIDSLSASVGAERLHSYVGEAASTTNFFDLLRATEGQTFSLHFSTHCENITFDQSSSFIVLSDPASNEGRVTAKQLDNLPRLTNLKHVSLASCQSGFPDLGRFASDPRGLATAFVNLGAESVLTSIYPLLDTPTTEIVTGMYRRQTEGGDIAEALRAEVCSRLKAARSAGNDVFSLDNQGPSGFVADHGVRAAVTALARGEAVLLTSWWAGLKPVCSG